MFLKISQDSQKNTTVLQPILKFILRFIFKSILQVPSCEFCEIFKTTFFTEHLRTSASAVGLLILYLCRYLEHLEGVITCYCAFIPTQIVVNRSFDWHVSDRVRNYFSFDDF